MAKSGSKTDKAKHQDKHDAKQEANHQPKPERADLVSAAIDALREAGYAGASAQEIAGRAGCAQSAIFEHFESVTDLLVAALEEVSTTRMAGYHQQLAGASSISGLAAAARAILAADRDAGYIRILVEMVTAAYSVTEMTERVAALLEPWRDVTEQAVRRSLGRSPTARLVPPGDAARAMVAMFLGLEMLAALDDDRETAIAVLDKTGSLARLLDMVAGLRLPGQGRDLR